MLLFCGRRLLLKVEGSSMLPSLNPDDRVLVRRTTADTDTPPLGAVVVAWHPSQPRLRLIKRLESMSNAGMMLLGDNPSSSTDSRQLGPIPRSALIGVVTSRVTPAKKNPSTKTNQKSQNQLEPKTRR
ncbi:possible peptidase S26 family protein [Synechococcus sp. CC9902]|nr:possible peptidase S26 family protein [Synechococcus sp. CC9902]